MGEKTTWKREKVPSKLQIKWVNNEVLLIIEKKALLHLNVLRRFLDIWVSELEIHLILIYKWKR